MEMSGHLHAPAAYLVTFWIGEWGNTKAGLDAAAKKKVLSLLLPRIEFRSSSP
jgi:hypothetical protein